MQNARNSLPEDLAILASDRDGLTSLLSVQPSWPTFVTVCQPFYDPFLAVFFSVRAEPTSLTELV